MTMWSEMGCIKEKIRKIKKKTCLISLAFLFFGGCDFPEKIPITKERMANKVLYQAAEDLKKEKELYASGSGGGMMDEIWMLALSFSYYKSITIEEGRELVIYAAQKLAEKINEEPRIHPYLYKYPFSPTHAEIRIFVKTTGYSPIEIVSFTDGFIKYKIDDPETKLLRTVYQETYAEGVEKLRTTSQSQKL